MFLLFMLPAVDDVPVPPPPPVVAVTLVTNDGYKFETGPAEAAVAAVPIVDDEMYRYDLCLQLQEARPVIDWGCVKP